MTYTAETRPKIARSKQILGTTDGEINGNITKISGVENINDCVLSRKREWNDHISKMDDNRMVKAFDARKKME